MRWLLVLLLLWPSVAFAKFAPVDGAALRYSVTEERGANRFTSERRIVFHKVAQGYTAELTIVAVDAGTGDVAAMALRVMSTLVGRTISYDLSNQGLVVAVADQDMLFATIIAGFDAMGAAGKDDSAARDAVAGRTAAALASLPDAAKRLLLGSLLTPVIGGALSDAQPGEGPVSLPASAPTGQSAALSGRQVVTRGADGRLVIDTDVSGPGPASDAPTMLRIVQHREIDGVTGLVLVNERRTDTWLTAKPDAVTTFRTRATLAPY